MESSVVAQWLLAAIQASRLSRRKTTQRINQPGVDFSFLTRLCNGILPREGTKVYADQDPRYAAVAKFVVEYHRDVQSVERFLQQATAEQLQRHGRNSSEPPDHLGGSRDNSVVVLSRYSRIVHQIPGMKIVISVEKGIACIAITNPAGVATTIETPVDRVLVDLR